MSFYDKINAATAPLMVKFKNPSGDATLERFTTTTNEIGGVERDWSVIDTFPIIVVPMSAEERLQASRLQSEVTHKAFALVDDVAAIDLDDRIKFDGRVFNVKSSFVIAEGGGWHKIEMKEGVAA